MISLSVGFITCVAVACGSVALFRSLLGPPDGAGEGDGTAARLQAPPDGDSVCVLATVDMFETLPVTVPLDAIHGLRYQAQHRCYEFGGYISSEDLPDEARRLPTREIAINVSVWRNAPATRRVLGERVRARAGMG